MKALYNILSVEAKPIKLQDLFKGSGSDVHGRVKKY